MVSALLSLIPAAINLIGGIAGKSESDKLAEKQRALKLSMPPEMLKQEAMARNLSQMGLPGYERYREDIGQITPSTVNQAKQVAQSPSQLIDLMSRSQTATNEALQNLQVRDAEAKRMNQMNYQNVLGQKGQMALGIQGANLQTEMGANLQEAQGTKDLFQSLNNAVSSGINTYSTISQLNYQEEYLKLLTDSWGKTDTDGNYGLGGKIAPTGLFSPAVTGQGMGSRSPEYEGLPIGKMPSYQANTLMGSGVPATASLSGNMMQPNINPEYYNDPNYLRYLNWLKSQ
jgi:hypothetical protein